MGGVDAAAQVRYARRRAGLSQRALAERAGVPQPTVARIESGRTRPRVDTFFRLTEACGFTVELEADPGLDRTVIRELLKMTPLELAELATAEAANMAELGL